MKCIAISEIMNGPWRERAIYTAEERGIPSFVDGMKPVQRFLIYSGYKNAYKNFDKVASIGSVIARYNYHHGEASACAALTGMAAEYCNNITWFEGDGNFGNILSPAAGAARYIFARLPSYIDTLLKDTEFAPKHPDPETAIPLYYLPIIPMVLVNGIKGIATGYATDIPPYDPLDIIDILEDLIKGKEAREPKPKYYNFVGNVRVFLDHNELQGVYELISPVKIRITELPRGNTSESYETFLRKLQDKDVISSYENNSCNGKFDYIVSIKKGTRWSDEQIIKTLKLVTTHTWNLTTVGINGKIKEWSSAKEIIEEFYKFRIPFVQHRIDAKVKEYELVFKYYTSMLSFVSDVVSGTYSFKGKTDEELGTDLKGYNVPYEYIEKVKNMPLRSFTKDFISDINTKKEEVEKNLEYYKTTTAGKEYKKDLEEFKTQYTKYLKQQN